MENRSNEIGAVAGPELVKMKESIAAKTGFRTEMPTDMDCERLDKAMAELHQCQKQEEGVRRRKSAARKVVNTLAGSYRHDNEVFIRYLERDKHLLFREKDNGKAHS